MVSKNYFYRGMRGAARQGRVGRRPTTSLASCSMFLMHVKDDQAWSQQLVEFDADEMSRLFRDFLVQWAETADRLVIIVFFVPGILSQSAFTGRAERIYEFHNRLRRFAKNLKAGKNRFFEKCYSC